MCLAKPQNSGEACCFWRTVQKGLPRRVWVKQALSLELGERSSQVEGGRKNKGRIGAGSHVSVSWASMEVEFSPLKVLVLRSAAKATLRENTAVLGAWGPWWWQGVWEEAKEQTLAGSGVSTPTWLSAGASILEFVRLSLHRCKKTLLISSCHICKIQALPYLCRGSWMALIGRTGGRTWAPATWTSLRHGGGTWGMHDRCGGQVLSEEVWGGTSHVPCMLWAWQTMVTADSDEQEQLSFCSC